MKLKRIIYSKINAKAQEMFNFQKASAKLADYGFTTMWLYNDWQGAHFIAIHVDGVIIIKVQLKGRLSFNREYIGKDIFICFRTDGEVYLYPHDLILEQIEHRIADRTWNTMGKWSSPRLTKENKRLLEPYLL